MKMLGNSGPVHVHFWILAQVVLGLGVLTSLFTSLPSLFSCSNDVFSLSSVVIFL